MCEYSQLLVELQYQRERQLPGMGGAKGLCNAL